MLKEEFLNEMKNLGGIDYEAFVRAMQETPEISIKLNRRKLTDPTDIGYDDPEPVVWCRSGHYLSSRPIFTLNPLLHAGAFYVQDASSMIYETIVEELSNRGLLPSAPLVLDLCAAPGGKTTSMINALPDGSFIVANEVMPQRVKILAENLQKWGYPDILVTSSPTSKFGALPDSFDLIAVDAPCSGEGMMRKDEEARRQWSPNLVRQCATLQRQILTDAIAALRPGGILIYSTCTFNRQEDEENVEWMVDTHGLEPIDLELPIEWGIMKQINSDLPALRFMPHATRGEGLFVAVVRKPGVIESRSQAKTIADIKKKTRVILDGIPKNIAKGKMEIPASQWALSTRFPIDDYQSAELDLDTALGYLRHEAITLPSNVGKGFVVVKYKGFPLGFVKNIGSRANNLYPSEWRIYNSSLRSQQVSEKK